VIESDFEHADLGGRRFPLVYAAQAWHWVDQSVGYARAHEALEAGGRFVAFWNRPAWGRTALREALDVVYARYAPDMEPGLARPIGLERYSLPDWSAEIAGVDRFGEREVRGYEWSLPYTTDEYADLVSTHSEVRRLNDGTRQALLTAIRDAVDAQGGSFQLPMHVRACIARAA
jgi:hypothetical protein